MSTKNNGQYETKERNPKWVPLPCLQIVGILYGYIVLLVGIDSRIAAQRILIRAHLCTPFKFFGFAFHLFAILGVARLGAALRTVRTILRVLNVVVRAVLCILYVLFHKFSFLKGR